MRPHDPHVTKTNLRWRPSGFLHVDWIVVAKLTGQTQSIGKHRCTWADCKCQLWILCRSCQPAYIHWVGLFLWSWLGLVDFEFNRKVKNSIDMHYIIQKTPKDERGRLLTEWCSTNFMRCYSQPHCSTPNSKRASVAYLNAVSEAAAWLLAQHGIIIAHKPTNTRLTNVIKLREPLDKLDQLTVIYKNWLHGLSSKIFWEIEKEIRGEAWRSRADATMRNLKSGYTW